MTLTLEIAPEVEAALQAKAQRRGMAVDAYLLDLAARDESDATSGDPFFAELDAIAQQFPTDAPPLANDAVARLYAEREATLL